jgi:hexosaminidase
MDLIKELYKMSDNQQDVYPLIPLPVQITSADGVFNLFNAGCIWTTPDVQEIGKYLKSLLVLPAKVDLAISASVPAGDIFLSTTGADPGLGDEGYQLIVTPEGVVIRANQPAGVFYGVQTLRQLIGAGKNIIPAVQISDRPRFAWRGIMLDVGRHIFSVDFIKRLIDAMAYQKLNVFHWHLTEDQGWRIEIKKYPRLTEIGSLRQASPVPANREKLDGIPYGGFFTQEQVKEIVAYAASRFITVVPEIEMPGHSLAALSAYPELGCTGGPYRVRPFWGIEKDVYCAGNEQVFTFLKNVLDEVLSLFPSRFIHIGGDECPKERWEECPKCQKAIQQNHLQNEHELQSYFVRRIEAYLNSQDRRLIGWDEILEGGLAPNASVMSWRGVEGGIKAAKQGHDVVMTPTDHCYFDYYQSQERTLEPPAIGGYLPLEKVYIYEPLPKELTVEEAKHILGVQGNLWTEYIPTEKQAEYMLFPRICALAEVAWSRREERDYAYFKQRLVKFLPLITKMGINFRKIEGDI